MAMHDDWGPENASTPYVPGVGDEHAKTACALLDGIPGMSAIGEGGQCALVANTGTARYPGPANTESITRAHAVLRERGWTINPVRLFEHGDQHAPDRWEIAPPGHTR